MSEPPREAELRRSAGGSVPAGGDQCGHRGQVVGVAGVPQAEENRDGDNDEQSGPVREPGDPVVEAEHGLPHFRESVDGHRDTRDEDDEGAHRR